MLLRAAGMASDAACVALAYDPGGLAVTAWGPLPPVEVTTSGLYCSGRSLQYEEQPIERPSEVNE
jgi:hypothetical protein